MQALPHYMVAEATSGPFTVKAFVDGTGSPEERPADDMEDFALFLWISPAVDIRPDGMFPLYLSDSIPSFKLKASMPNATVFEAGFGFGESTMTFGELERHLISGLPDLVEALHGFDIGK